MKLLTSSSGYDSKVGGEKKEQKREEPRQEEPEELAFCWNRASSKI
jgi:hypothetical protein